jgi:hypothetical protein
VQDGNQTQGEVRASQDDDTVSATTPFRSIQVSSSLQATRWARRWAIRNLLVVLWYNEWKQPWRWQWRLWRVHRWGTLFHSWTCLSATTTPSHGQPSSKPDPKSSGLGLKMLADSRARLSLRSPKIAFNTTASQRPDGAISSVGIWPGWAGLGPDFLASGFCRPGLDTWPCIPPPTNNDFYLASLTWTFYFFLIRCMVHREIKWTY